MWALRGKFEYRFPPRNLDFQRRRWLPLLSSARQIGGNGVWRRGSPLGSITYTGMVENAEPSLHVMWPLGLLLSQGA